MSLNANTRKLLTRTIHQPTLPPLPRYAHARASLNNSTALESCMASIHRRFFGPKLALMPVQNAAIRLNTQPHSSIAM